MRLITCKFVRPDKLVYQGQVKSLILVTPSGELGVWPLHAPLICALGDGVVRLNLTDEAGGGTLRVLVSGGYAEVHDDEVIVLADHARREDEIDVEHERRELAAAKAERDRFVADDVRRAHYDNTIRWCQQLIDYAERRGQGG